MNNQSAGSILIVEDDIELQQWIADYLTGKGFTCICTENGTEAVTLITDMQPDIVLLDGALPGLDGFAVCKTVRPFFRGAIIMITARDEEIDEILGLEAGADDYLIKPIRARALLTRIQKLLEKKVITAHSKTLTFNNLVIDPYSQSALLAGIDAKLTSKEFEVLWVLASHPGEIVTRDTLLKELRGYEFDGLDRSIDLRISRVRKKLNDSGEEPYRIKTIWGKGYLFVRDAW
ncbi:response regulator transcription factor [Cellvibrio sp. pealriver]|uniref:response regulator transcription factor n=1 Tax=Cellvibrio sp. pealriver TaxID=1622269 RepID=UPI00066FD263|nr:response regulator transcription factor [Cellvibrio sp. pealriver]